MESMSPTGISADMLTCFGLTGKLTTLEHTITTDVDGNFAGAGETGDTVTCRDPLVSPKEHHKELECP